MASIPELFKRLKSMEDEIRHLRGRIQAISVGQQIINPVPGTAAVPTPVQGAMIAGNATPAWERVPPPSPGPTDVYQLTFEDGDITPQWRLRTAVGRYRMFVYTVGGGTFDFITDGAGNPIFVLQDLE